MDLVCLFWRIELPQLYPLKCTASWALYFWNRFCNICLKSGCLSMQWPIITNNLTFRIVYSSHILKKLSSTSQCYWVPLLLPVSSFSAGFSERAYCWDLAQRRPACLVCIAQWRLSPSHLGAVNLRQCTSITGLLKFIFTLHPFTQDMFMQPQFYKHLK